MDQFTNKQQIDLYDSTRPKYTQEIFTEILSHITTHDLYIDLACGTGQLLFPIGVKFKKSIGVDASEEQIKKAKDNLVKFNLSQDKFDIFASDVYNCTNTDNAFDLVTMGQAFHWFDPDKLLSYVKNIIKPGGVFVITGYKKQHFEESQANIYSLFQEVINKLKPYFECDVDYNDNAYYKSMDLFEKYFGKSVEVKFHKEEMEVNLRNIINLVKSWSAYVNYIKNLGDGQDILTTFEKELHTKYGDEKKLEDINEKYFNFYFTITLKKEN